MTESIKAQYEETLVEEVKAIKEELQDRLDSYLEYVADEWYLKMNSPSSTVLRPR